MEITVRKKKDFKTSKWSGGDTTELYLYPEDGDYASRNFKVRISSATVDVDKSDFTSLPGVKRYLSIFSGQLDMVHGEDNKVSLKPYEVDCFDGGVPTVSYGRVVDFNLMLKDGAEGCMEGMRLASGEAKEMTADKNYNLLAVYVKEGKINVQGVCAAEGELLLIKDWKEDMKVENVGGVPAGLGICKVNIS